MSHGRMFGCGAGLTFMMNTLLIILMQYEDKGMYDRLKSLILIATLVCLLNEHARTNFLSNVSACLLLLGLALFLKFAQNSCLFI